MRLKKKFLFSYGLSLGKEKVTIHNPFCPWKHHPLTVASAPTILQTPRGVQQVCNATSTQLLSNLGLDPTFTQSGLSTSLYGVSAIAAQGDWRGL